MHAVPTVLVTAVATDLIEADLAELRQTGADLPQRLPRLLQKPVSAETLNAALLEAVEAFESAEKSAEKKSREGREVEIVEDR